MEAAEPQHQPKPRKEEEEEPKEEKETERGTNSQTIQHILEHHEHVEEEGEEAAEEEQQKLHHQENEQKDRHIISTSSSPSPSSSSSSSSSHIELDLSHEKDPQPPSPSNNQTTPSSPPPQSQPQPQPQPPQPPTEEHHIIESSSPSSVSSRESSPGRLSIQKAEESAATPLHVPTPPPSTARRSVRDPHPVITKVETGIGDGFVGNFHVTSGDGGGVGTGGGGGKRLRQSLSILKRTKRESMVRRALLGFRICGFVFCLVSFSVLAADRNQGWALDSFYRYKEFRFSLAVNVIGFVYSGLQACDLSYNSATGKHVAQHHLRHYLNFVLDQVLSYLLISSASSAATRVEDWESNWGQDKFPQMATASVGLSILAFLAFAFCSMVSGYMLCTLGYNYS